MNERRGASVSCITWQATVDGPSSHQRPTTPPPHLFGLLSTVFGYLMVFDAGRCPEARCNVSQNSGESRDREDVVKLLQLITTKMKMMRFAIGARHDGCARLQISNIELYHKFDR